MPVGTRTSAFTFGLGDTEHLDGALSMVAEDLIDPKDKPSNSADAHGADPTAAGGGRSEIRK